MKERYEKTMGDTSIKPYRSWPGFKSAVCEEFFDKCKKDPDLLVFPRKDYLSVYCNGQQFVKLTPSKSKKVSQYSDDNEFKERKKTVSVGMPKDKERRAQQQIAARHLSRKTDIVICDMEFSIRKKDFGIKLPGIDLIGLDFSNPKLPRPVFIEYKRTKNAVKGKSGVLPHFNDMAEIYSNPELKKALAEGAMASYNILIDLGVLDAEHLTNIDTENGWFAFLFTDLQVKDFYGYLSKILAKQKQDKNMLFPLRVASFDTYEETVLRTDKFEDITEFLRNNQEKAGRHPNKPVFN
ncbi:hypothetical protein SDC9_75336 [bioreactor metagenome]|uniref:Uncharacterized protein n=1 Tax=bioreactor metagenome TaxID=1076179 RepID=A0A644YJQ5_9ZZZZ